MSDVRNALRAKFAALDVSTRQGGGSTKLDYVPIEKFLGRLLDATDGYRWSSSLQKAEQVDRKKNDGTVVQEWVAVVQGYLEIDGYGATGVGAMQNADLDMAVKSANSEAIKNAAKNGFGVGLELWDKEYRDGLAQARKAATGDESAMKQIVWRIATTKLGHTPTSAAEVADLFGVAAGDLSDPAVLSAILSDEGVV